MSLYLRNLAAGPLSGPLCQSVMRSGVFGHLLMLQIHPALPCSNGFVGHSEATNKICYDRRYFELRKYIINPVARKHDRPASKNAGTYVIKKPRDTPAPYAEKAAPPWCAAKIQANISGPFTVPKYCPVNLTVGGTVAIKSKPKNMAQSVSSYILKLP